jgi:glucose/arabinose dehydrogenase
MNEHRFGREIKGFLNQGLDLSPAQVERLKKARDQAVANQRQPRFEWAPAWAGRALGPIGVLRGGRHPLAWTLPLLIALAGAWGYHQWQAPHEDSPYTDIDTEILKSRLPFDAHLDHGFQQWLKGESQ